MKYPSFQFYPGDWRKDMAVQSLDYFHRGVWFELLCLMFDSPERGKLILNGSPASDDQVARLLGLDKQVCLKTINALLAAGVASKCPQTQALMSRRMVRDEEIRRTRQECGKKGGNPSLLNQMVNQEVIQTPNQIPEDEDEDEKVLKEERGAGGRNEKKVLLATHARVVIHYLNEKANRKYREVDGHLAKIARKLKEPGVTLDGIKEMIDSKVAEWVGTDYEKYLDPETLFGGKFAKYYDNRKLPVRRSEPAPNTNGKQVDWWRDVGGKEQAA